MDIRVNKSPAYFLLPEKEFYYIDYKGIHNKKSDASDFFLMSYSEEDGMRFFKFIGCKFEDIFNVARHYIERLYELDKYLSKQKKKDYLG